MWAAEDNGTSYTDQTLVADEPTPCHDPVPLSILDGSENHFDKVWSLVTVDLAGRTKDHATGVTMVNYPLDNIPGMRMADGGFIGFNACFNVMVDCDDNDKCTEDSFNGATVAEGKICTHTTIICTNGGTCDPETGTCCPPNIECPDDGNVCTREHIDPATCECLHTPVTIGCDDGLACTEHDTCDKSNGICTGQPIDCDDGNPCTADSCDENAPLDIDGKHCVHTNLTSSCHLDSNTCQSDEVCQVLMGGVAECRGTCIPGCFKENVETLCKLLQLAR